MCGPELNPTGELWEKWCRVCVSELSIVPPSYPGEESRIFMHQLLSVSNGGMLPWCVLGAHRVVSAAWEKALRQRCECWQLEVNQCTSKWQGLGMWAGYQQHPLCWNKTSSPPPVFPIIIKCIIIYSVSHAKDLTIILDMFFVCLFCCLVFCSCHTFSLSPNPVNSIFKVYLESYDFSPALPSSFTRFLQ